MQIWGGGWGGGKEHLHLFFPLQGTTDERVVQLMRLLNKLLEAHPPCRSKGLAWHTPLVVPVWPQVCVNRMWFV